MSSKIAKTGGLNNNRKPVTSTVPSLPVVNGNTTNPNGYIRPLSVENGHSHKQALNSNSTSKLTDFRPSNSVSNYSTPSSVKDSKSAGGGSNNNGKGVNLQNSVNFDNSEEFGLSVTKIDNTNGTAHDNKPVNGTPKQQQNGAGIAKRRNNGQIIDFRAMINEATKISFGGGGPGGVNGNGENGHNTDNDNSDKLMKPLAGYIGYNSEWRELAQTISRVSRINFMSSLRFSG